MRLAATMLALPGLLLLAAAPATEAELAWQRVVRDRGTHSGNPAAAIDVRVTPGFGAKGYGKLRISVVTNATSPLPDSDNFFDYKAPFKYRWTDKFLHSALKTVVPGKATTFTINGTSFAVRVPEATAGSKGLLIADPCFHGAAAGCTYGDKYQTFERMTALLNAAMQTEGDGALDYWGILGDNFYDRYGPLSQAWFDQLTLATKSKVFMTVAGNHDYWALGDGILSSSKDQYANGHMQFYAMDSAASRNESNPEFLDFSVNPDTAGIGHRLASLDNFFSYFNIGNVAYLLYSGGYSYSDTKALFQEGCAWFKQVKPRAAFIAGHWNDAGLGCSDQMDVPAVWKEIKGFDGCAQLEAANNLKYVMGHTHCNEVTQADTGFMLAGQGMEGCGNFGVPIVESTEDRLEVLYYNVQDTKGTDAYDTILKCFQDHGALGCKEHATVWLNQTLAPVEW